MQGWWMGGWVDRPYCVEAGRVRKGGWVGGWKVQAASRLAGVALCLYYGHRYTTRLDSLDIWARYRRRRRRRWKAGRCDALEWMGKTKAGVR